MSEKQKKPIYKRKWFIALAALLVLGAIGSFFEEEPTEAPEPAETAQAEEQPTQDFNMESYKADVADVFTKHAQDFDLIRGNTQNTINSLSQDGDIYAAYEGVKNSSRAMESLRQRVSDMEAPDYLTKDQKELFGQVKTALYNASGYSRSAYDDLAKDLDKGDLSPSRIENQKEWTSMVDQEIIKYAASLAALNADVGYVAE